MDQVKREIEHRWRDLGEFVREQRRIGEMSLRRLSELSGISNPYLSQIERGMRRPSAEILQQLARALEISSETLYVRAGILDPATDQSDLLDAVRRDAVLTEAQKRTLIHIYESFRNETLAARVASGVDAGAPGATPPGDPAAGAPAPFAESPGAPEAPPAPVRRRTPARKRASGESGSRSDG